MSVAGGLVLGLALLAPLAVADEPAPGEVVIRRTAQGIPHVLATDYEGMGFGVGYAFAQDNICTAADFYVTVSAERSRYFGPDASWTFHGNGTTANNLNSDFFFQQIIDEQRVERLLDQPPPHGPVPEVRDGVRGYVAGYNRYLGDVGVGNLPDPRCRGAEWVREITELDAYRRFYQLALLASSGVAIDGIGSAQPLVDVGALPDPSAVTDPAGLLEELPTRLNEALGVGSNAYGFGSEVTSNGRGMVLGNPHFPWQGGERLYQMHLTIPGRLNVSGAGLYGVPLVLIGHTDGMAWSHTVSTAFRFTPYELKLVPGMPTTYLYDGVPTPMEAREVTVQVPGADGSLEPRTRTLHSTLHGPLITSILGLPIFPWTPVLAFAIRDANAENFRYLNHFFFTNHAQSVRELNEVQERFQGVPWVNTIAADRHGEAYYADISVVPNVPDEMTQTCVNGALGLVALPLLGLPILDGSTSDCEWRFDDDAVQPGTFGPGNLPKLFRDDYTSNSNDSYWLTNPAEPLEGYAGIIGDERTERTLRTRIGLVMAEEAKTAAANGERLDVEALMGLVFNNRQHAGELVRDDLVALCRSLPGGFAPTTSGPPLPVEEACDALEGWDLRDDLDSKGAILFRRFWSHASGAVPSPWQAGFDPVDPVHTPHTLAASHPQVTLALGDGIADLQGAGIPLDAPLRGWQYKPRNDELVPIHGGPGGLGVFNAINVAWDPQRGHPDVLHGSSFVMAVQFTDGPCPDAHSITIYGQSENPESPYYSDQMWMYAGKEWVRNRYCEADILADPELQVTRFDGAPTDDRAPGPALPATGGGALLIGLLGLLLAALTRGARPTPPGPRRPARRRSGRTARTRPRRP